MFASVNVFIDPTIIGVYNESNMGGIEFNIVIKSISEEHLVAIIGPARSNHSEDNNIIVISTITLHRLTTVSRFR